MSKIRVDGRTMALSHPTRRALYEALLEAEEMSTVLLQKATEVTRYHLYHHLQSLQRNGLVENHRNQGRARWWRVTERVIPGAAPSPDWAASLPESARALLEAGAEAHVIPIPASATDQIGARKALEEIAAAYGVELDMAFTFMPNSILVIGPSRRA
ncbi:MAG TPA: ArsR family transcriptional regulator [Candidatus Poseidoniales archaeon]|nr:ArsR family transcriptional regulator [Candidatus Poseidoniales archaeon]